MNAPHNLSATGRTLPNPNPANPARKQIVIIGGMSLASPVRG